MITARSTLGLRTLKLSAMVRLPFETILTIISLVLETFYMFGDNDYEEWKDFLEEYQPPPYNLPNHLPALSFGVAGSGSGVPFHTHG